MQELKRTESVHIAENVRSSGLSGYHCGRGHLFLSITSMHEKVTWGDQDTHHGNAEILPVQKRQKMLNDALRLLFDLLEEYSPLWYTKEHHDQADQALQGDENSLL